MTVKRTIAHMQYDRLTKKPDAPSYYYYQDEQWKPIRNREALTQSTEMGMGLWSLGVRHADRVAVMANSRYEWDLMDGAALNIGAAVVSIYPTSTESATRYILDHSGAKVVVLETVEHWNLVAPHLESLSNLEQIIMIDPAGMAAGDWIDLDKLRELGRAQMAERPALPEEARAAVQPDDLASLMYTSGTTGNPKGVALKHDMLYSVIEILCDVAPLEEGDRGVIYLPMSHILQRVNVYLGRFVGIAGYFAPTIADFVMTCQAANPRSLSCVPRVLEKVHARIMTGVEQAPENRRKLITRALEVGKQRSRLERDGRSIPLFLRLQSALFERLVYKKLRTSLFGDSIEYLTCGAAPISIEILEFFDAIQLPVLEGYGLTETCSPITLNLPEKRKIGTVGPPLPGSEVKIAEDGEILLKGPSVFEMYYNNPEATADSFTADGWFKSGDIGEVDDKGFLRITDRKKYLIITAAGKNIAPAPIEQKLLQHPLVGQVVVHGDQRKYLSAVMTLDPETLAVWAAKNGKEGMAMADLAADSQVMAEIDQFVNEVNEKLARYETIKKFHILPEDFTIDNGYLTPSMKIKRKQVEKDFVAVLDGMY